MTIIISPCPEPSPSLVNDQFFAPPGGRPIPIDIFANDPSSVGTLVVSPVSAGSLVGGAGKYTYTAPVGFNDNATFSYTVTNVCGVPGTATVTIDVNRRPTANPDLASTARNRDVIVPVLGNDTDPDLPNDALTSSWCPGRRVTARSSSLTAVEFDPDRRFSGDGSFQYYVQDSGGLASSPVTVTIRVGVNAAGGGQSRCDHFQRLRSDLLQRLPAAHRRSRRRRSHSPAGRRRVGRLWSSRRRARP